MALRALIGTVAGVASALLLLIPLPLYVAGLGWGFVAACAGTAAAFLLIAGSAGPATALAYTVAFTAPVCALSWYGDKVRAANGVLDAGLILAGLTLFAGLLAGAATLGVATDIESFRTILRDLLETEVATRLETITGSKLSEADKDLLAGQTVRYYPVIVACGWLLLTVFFVLIAAVIVRASGCFPGRRPVLAAMEFPALMPALYALALLATFLPDISGVIARGVAGALTLGHGLLGLAVTHGVMRGRKSRVPVLIAVYLAIFLFGPLALICLAIFAVAEPMLGLRNNLNRSATGPT